MKKLALALLLLGFILFPAKASAMTHTVTVNSNGTHCGDGGFFEPSSLTIDDGDTITFTLPADDPYQNSELVKGVPTANSSLLIPLGGSKTTVALHDNATFNAYWGNGSCHKGSGTVTVNDPPADDPPASGGSSSGGSSSGTTKKTTSSSSSDDSSSTKKTADKTTTDSDTPTTSQDTATGDTSSDSSSALLGEGAGLATETSGQSSSIPVIPIFVALVIAAGAAAFWFFKIRKKAPKVESTETPVVTPPETPDRPA